MTGTKTGEKSQSSTIEPETSCGGTVGGQVVVVARQDLPSVSRGERLCQNRPQTNAEAANIIMNSVIGPECGQIALFRPESK